MLEKERIQGRKRVAAITGFCVGNGDEGITFCQMQRKTHILILCNQTGVEDLGSPKSPILDSPREGEKVQVKKSPFCTRELSPQAPCLPQLMAFMIEPPRFMPPFSGPVQQKGKVGHREERAVTYGRCGVRFKRKA